MFIISFTLPAAGQFRMSNDAGVARSASASNTKKADPIPDNNSTVGVQGGRYGVGLASSWPAYGISGTIQMSETITGEAVLGFFGSVSNFGGRLLYRFNRNEKYDIFGYGALGVYRYRGYDYDFFDDRRSVTESVLGIGFGAGVETGLQKLFEDEGIPPIFVSSELGLAIASFEYYGGFSSISLGFGIHYRFGEKD